LNTWNNKTGILDIKAREDQIIEEFNSLDDPMMRYEYLIDLGKMLPSLDEKFKTEEYVVKGCQSTVWLRSFVQDGKVIFEADSNTIITKGIIALLIRVLSGLPADEIISSDLSFIEKINLKSHLSEQRSSGLNAMLKQMKLDALVYKTKMITENGNS
jgi:cysteine desulfuration protein SufE